MSAAVSSVSSRSMREGTYDPLQNPASDEWYLDFIKQYEGSEFYDRLLNNPYLRKNNARFSPNVLQKLGGLFGSTQGEDEYYGNLLNLRNQELAEVIDLIRQQEHNDPLNEVARRKAAGLNDDLNGGSAIGTGAAVENDQPKGGMPSMVGDEGILSVVSGLWDCFSKAYSFTIGFMQDKQTLQQLKNLTESGDIENFEKWLNLGNRVVSEQFGGTPHTVDDPRTGFIPSEWYSSFFRNRKRAKKFEKVLGIAHSSWKSSKALNDSISDLQESAMRREKVSGEFSASFSDQGDTILRDFSKDMMSLSMELQRKDAEIRKWQQKVDLVHSQNMFTYENLKDYGSLADMENQSLLASKEQHMISSTLNGFLSKWSARLEAQSHEGGLSGVFASAMLGFLSMQSLNILPNISLPSMNFTTRNNTFLKQNVVP